MEDATSSNDLMLPSVSNKAALTVTSTKLVHCELSTICEEMLCPQSPFPKDCSAQKSIAIPNAQNCMETSSSQKSFETSSPQKSIETSNPQKSIENSSPTKSIETSSPQKCTETQNSMVVATTKYISVEISSQGKINDENVQPSSDQ